MERTQAFGFILKTINSFAPAKIAKKNVHVHKVAARKTVIINHN